MAWALSLQNDTTTLNLNDAINYTALQPFNAPVPSRRVSVGGMNMSRHGSIITNRVFNNRNVSFRILISGTSQDNLIANINAIHNLLERTAEYTITGLGSQTILRRKWENATNQVDFNVLDGVLTIGDEFSITHRVNTKVLATLTLICEPFAYGAEETIENYVLDAGFELAGTALADWTESKTATGTTARDTSVTKDGLGSLKLTMTNSGGSGQVIERSQVLADVDAGEVWSFQCWVRVDALSNAKVVMELDYNTGTDVEVATTTVNASSFVKLTANNNTVPGSVTQVTLRIRLEATASSATGVAYIDNVIAVLAAAVPSAWASSRSIGNHQADDSQLTSNYIDIQDVSGDVPAELQVRIQEAGSHAKFWAGARHGSQQFDDLYIEGDANTASATLVSPSDYGVNSTFSISNAVYSNGTARYSVLARPASGASALGEMETYFRHDYAITTLPRGTFRVLLSCNGSTVNGSNDKNAAQFNFMMGWTYGGVTLISITDPPTTSAVELSPHVFTADAESNKEILDLGTITIPPVVTPDNMTDGTLTLSIFSGWDVTPAGVTYSTVNDANQDMMWNLDFIHFMPIDRGSNYTTKTHATDYILLDSMSEAKGLYLVDSADVIQSFPSEQFGRSPEAHPEGTRIYILAQEAIGTGAGHGRGHIKGDTFTIRVRYRPKFLQVMGV